LQVLVGGLRLCFGSCRNVPGLKSFSGLASNHALSCHAHQHQPHHDVIQRSAARRGYGHLSDERSVGEYLKRYAEMFDLTRRVRLKTPVRELRRDADGWIVRTDAGEERFAQVVVATGRYHKPAIPDVPGLKSFSGPAGANHTFSYKRPGGSRRRGIQQICCNRLSSRGGGCRAD
jgi:cation diffusion facilitator CzcD-associated flavoprotein CzcO